MGSKTLCTIAKFVDAYSHANHPFSMASAVACLLHILRTGLDLGLSLYPLLDLKQTG